MASRTYFAHVIYTHTHGHMSVKKDMFVSALVPCPRFPQGDSWMRH